MLATGFIFLSSIQSHAAKDANLPIREAGSTPAFWQVSSPNSKVTVYLLGSMHFGIEDFYPLPKEIMDAFEKSKSLAVEVNVDAIDPLEAQKVVAQLGFLPGDQTLETLLSKSEKASLEKICDQLGIGFPAIQKLRPWMAALQIVTLQMSRLEYKPNIGIDRHFLSQAKDKNILELESLNSQLGLFNQLEQSTQIAFLKQTMTEYDQGETYLDLIASAWRSGDIKQLESLVLDNMLQDPSMHDLNEKLFTERNIKMAKQISKMLDSHDHNVFVVVGAGHLLGADGIVATLAKDYRVERVAFKESAKKHK